MDDLTDKSTSPPAENNGSPGRETGNLNSFQSPSGPGASSPGKSSASGGQKGKGKAKIGRPSKNTAGFSKEVLDQEIVDPEIEASRVEFEGVLVHLLVATTEGIRDTRFEVLKKQYPADVAKGMADKALLTEPEKKYFSSVVIRLWRKYLGDKYLFSDESIAAAYVGQYLLRNWTGMAEAKKIEQELKEQKVEKQPGLQSAAGSGDRRESDGKNDANGAPGPQPSGAVNSNI